jgi:hypothetical protein
VAHRSLVAAMDQLSRPGRAIVREVGARLGRWAGAKVSPPVARQADSLVEEHHRRWG